MARLAHRQRKPPGVAAAKAEGLEVQRTCLGYRAPLAKAVTKVREPAGEQPGLRMRLLPLEREVLAVMRL
ncbi:MAG: hypothetical protein ACRDGT_07615 [Candidatus Limnocylindria bacterium]